LVMKLWAKTWLSSGWPRKRVPCDVSEFLPRAAKSVHRCRASSGDMSQLKIGDVFVREARIFVLLRFRCIPRGGPSSANVVRNHERSWCGKRSFVSSTNDFVWAKDPRLSSPKCVWFSFWIVARCLSCVLTFARRMCSARLAVQTLWFVQKRQRFHLPSWIAIFIFKLMGILIVTMSAWIS
jgi:hypothetical protein